MFRTNVEINNSIAQLKSSQQFDIINVLVWLFEF